MAPGLKQLFKREAEPETPEEDVGEDGEESAMTTMGTKIFGKLHHQHRSTSTTVATVSEGERKDFPSEM